MESHLKWRKGQLLEGQLRVVFSLYKMKKGQQKDNFFGFASGF